MQMINPDFFFTNIKQLKTYLIIKLFLMKKYRVNYTEIQYDVTIEVQFVHFVWNQKLTFFFLLAKFPYQINCKTTRSYLK